MFLVRKITRAKRQGTQDVSAGEIAADAVTGDLRTQGNTLAFWRCHTGTNGDIEEAALAIAAVGERTDRFDIIWLADGRILEDTEGQTPVAEFAHRHVDMRRLDYVRLGKVACRVVAAIEDERCQRLTKKRVKEFLSTAVKQGVVSHFEIFCSVKITTYSLN